MRPRGVTALIGLLSLALLALGCSPRSSDSTSTSSLGGPTSTAAPSRDATTSTHPQLPVTTTSRPTQDDGDSGEGPGTILVFHKTEGFRHQSIGAGISAVGEIAAVSGFTVTATEDSSVFSREGLDGVDVVVFMNTTGDVLGADEQTAMERFIASGGGFVGVHGAADTEYDWAWYGGLVGAYFDSHPQPQSARVQSPTPGAHPVSDGLPAGFEMVDEWYNFRTRPEPNVVILATLDETSYEGGTMGADHPIAWAHEYSGGRSVYLGFGHTDEAFRQPQVLQLLDNAIVWAAGSSD